MKKIAFVAVLIAVIVGIVFGGISLASAAPQATPTPTPTPTQGGGGGGGGGCVIPIPTPPRMPTPPPPPTPTPNCCVEMLNRINTLDQKVTALQGSVDTINNELENVPKIWGYSGNFTVIYTTCRTDPYVSPSPQEPAGPKHVVMTIDFSGIVDGSDHGVLVEATIGNNNTPVTIWAYVGFVPSEPHFITLDFVANDWDILAANCGGDDFTIYYSVNVTGI